MSTSAIARAAGRAVVLPGADIDTDRIIPARYLKAITFDGLGARVFEDDRAQARTNGGAHPLDAPASAGARVLIVGANFGCGSSREHAPRAIHQWGIRAIVGRSFAEIFASNAVAIGLPCVTVPADAMDRIAGAVQTDPSVEVSVDLETMQVTAGGEATAAAMPDTARHALLSGHWDATTLLLENYHEVEAVRDRLAGSIGVRS